MSNNHWRSLTRLASLTVAFLLTSCAAEPQSHALRAERAVGPPRFIQLDEEPSISTIHFPRGIYSLDSSDAEGYYYRAPRRLIAHSFGGFNPQDGGIFVSKRSGGRMSGYVVWAGGVTKIGNLSRSRHQFRG